MDKKAIVYLACPYSHPCEVKRKERFEKVTTLAAGLMAQGYRVFSPISHSHHIADHLPEELRTEWDGFWKVQDFTWLHRCDEMYVYTLPGWEESVGVQAEIAEAKRQGIPVVFIGNDPKRGPVVWGDLRKGLNIEFDNMPCDLFMGMEVSQ